MFDKLKLKLYNYMHRWYVNSLPENAELIVQILTILKDHPDLNSLSYKDGLKDVKITIGWETLIESPSQERHLFVRVNDIIVFEMSNREILILRNGKWRKAIELMSFVALYELLKKQNSQIKNGNLGPFQNIEEDVIV